MDPTFPTGGHAEGLPPAPGPGPEKEALFYRLTQRCMQVADVSELGFVLVNDTWQLLPYQQAVFLQHDSLGLLTLRTVSGLATVGEDSPFTLWLTRLMRLAEQSLAARAPTRITASLFDGVTGDSWAEWWPEYGVYVPLFSTQGEPLGVVVLVRELPWQDSDLQDLQALSQSWAFVCQALRGPRPMLSRLWQRAKTERRARLTAALAALVLCIPVRISALAPAEIIALQAQALSAPMDGVVKAFAVPPNSAVRKGDLLFTLDDTTLRNRRDVAQKSLDVSRADALAAQQKAFDNVQSKSELGTLSGRVREKEAELAYLGETLMHMEVHAPLDGVFVYTDPNDWVGKPVATGERIGQLAQAHDLGVLVWLPVGDAINLEPGASMRVYLQVAPLQSLTAELVQTSYQATPSPDGISSYRVRGKLAPGEEARIGMRGVAKVYGNWRPLVYWVLRRPLGAARQWLGI